MLIGVLLITISGLLAGELAGRAGFPKLVGMLIIGVILGPHVFDFYPECILIHSEEIRMFALLIILFKAGLGLDRNKIMANGSVAVRLGFLPAVIEAMTVALATRWILGWDWLIFGCLAG